MVSGRTGVATRELVLLTGRGHPELARSVAEELGVAVTPQAAYDFANGEVFVRFEESVRGADAFVVQSHSAPVNDRLVELLLMVDAAKRASAKRITAVVPAFPYARQDRKYAGREPVSARLVAGLLKTAGADRIVTVDLHTAQAQGFFDGPVDHLHAMWLLTGHVRARYRGEGLTIVSPDAGRTRLAEKWADLLGGCPIAFLHKTRDSLRPNEVTANRVVGDVAGRMCVVVDDMIDTALASTTAARELLEQGAKDVVLVATHGVLSGDACERLVASEAREVVLTDALPIPHERRFPGMAVLGIAPLLARAIQEVFEDGSVTGLFDGNA
ncbi:ribose-phosphate pyrophosphokinase [Lentzea xinjiangensis]|uniref:ribose-phosphate diphosphokinase n=1 Tax=Lentzea xinjiangensis TaxID=402600 RepID=A0A1H9VV40_9PSEU|nr:ribose-phosphate diphosphokinase [Lentzea xinjiangensis]SES25143.1 ribose-phosphate pyrophosphokinase [Lentzea xinjiangensis]